jgi:hypothetical protein
MKSFLGSLLFSLCVTILTIDVYAAVKLCMSGQWGLGLAVGFPAYAAFWITAPVTILLAVCFFGALAVKVEDKIKRGNKFQY